MVVYEEDGIVFGYDVGFSCDGEWRWRGKM